MKLRIYSFSYVKNRNKTNRTAGCGLVLLAEYKDKIIYRKHLGFTLANSDLLLSDLQSIRLALSSIDSSSKCHNIELHTNSKEAIEYMKMVNDDYIKECDKHSTIISEIRKLYLTFNSIDVILDMSNDQYMMKSKSLAEAACDKQINIEEHI